MGQTLNCFCKGIKFIQSYRPEEAIPDSYDKCQENQENKRQLKEKQRELLKIWLTCSGNLLTLM